MDMSNINWQMVFNIVAIVIGAAKAIAILTPPKTDDEYVDATEKWWNRFRKVVEVLGLSVRNAAPITRREKYARAAMQRARAIERPAAKRSQARHLSVVLALACMASFLLSGCAPLNPNHNAYMEKAIEQQGCSTPAIGNDGQALVNPRTGEPLYTVYKSNGPCDHEAAAKVAFAQKETIAAACPPPPTPPTTESATAWTEYERAVGMTNAECGRTRATIALSYRLGDGAGYQQHETNGLDFAASIHRDRTNLIVGLGGAAINTTGYVIGAGINAGTARAGIRATRDMVAAAGRNSGTTTVNAYGGGDASGGGDGGGSTGSGAPQYIAINSSLAADQGHAYNLGIGNQAAASESANANTGLQDRSGTTPTINGGATATVTGAGTGSPSQP